MEIRYICQSLFIKWIFFIWVSLSYSFSFASATCESVFLESKDHIKWVCTTSRSCSTYLSSINQLNNFKGVRGKIPKFDVDSIRKGRRSIVSLGEGNADFILKLLEGKTNLTGWLLGSNTKVSAYAVDLLYIRDSEEYAYSPESTKKMLSRHPENYIGSAYQDFTIRDNNGNQLLMDEVVSSSSLNFVLSHYFAKKRAGEARDLLINILNQMNSGGVLRSWTDDKIKLDSSEDFKNLLNQLAEEGLIADYAIIPRPNRIWGIEGFLLMKP